MGSNGKITLEERELLRSLVANERVLVAMGTVLGQEAHLCKARLVNEAMTPSSPDPVVRLTRQTEYAARAKQLEEVINLLRRAAQ